MKRYLKWLGFVAGLAAFILVDIWVFRMLKKKPPPPAAGTVLTQAELEALNLSDALPPDVKASDVPVIRPKWIKLPPIVPHRMTNGMLKVDITRPDDPGAYHDARFDWSGMISRVEYNGHVFFNGPAAQLDDKTPYPVFGTAEEFGSDGPLGYEEARVGQTFVKIGVGELRKPAAPPWYYWAFPYEIVKPGTWKIDPTDSWIEYEQHLEGPRGIAYRYHKRVALDEGKPVIRITRTLENQGKRPLATSHFCHNFVTINREKLIGPPWRVEFAYPLTPHPRERYWRTRGMVAIDGRTLLFTQPLQGAVFLLMTSAPREASDNWFRVSNPDLGAAVTMQGDRAVYKIAMYANNPAVCPEPFVRIELAPGEKQTWENVYTFEADPSKATASQPVERSWQERLRDKLGTRPQSQRAP